MPTLVSAAALAAALLPARLALAAELPLHRDVRAAAAAIEREVRAGEEDRGLADVSAAVLERLADARSRASDDARSARAFNRLEDLFRSLPRRRYAEAYALDLAAAVAAELRAAADDAADDAELLARLQRDLELPESVPGDTEPEDEAFFPVDVPLAQFKKLGAVKVFMMKHRLKRPPSHAPTTPESIVGGEHHVEVGVEVEGKVTSGSLFPFDQDYCFNIGDLHIELTPEWRLKHPKIPEP